MKENYKFKTVLGYNCNTIILKQGKTEENHVYVLSAVFRVRGPHTSCFQREGGGKEYDQNILH